MNIYLSQLLQISLYVVLAPLLAGLVKWLKCVAQNRHSPSLFRPYRNMIKLFCKQVIIPVESSWIYRAAPYIVFAVMLLASMMVPLLFVSSTQQHLVLGDVIVLIGVLALGRFFVALAGMDIGTAFGGMGSSREMMISSLAEPSSLLVLFTLALTASSTNLNVIINHLMATGFIFRPSFVFLLLGLAMITLAETGRIPIDNPTTHLELTMVHEAMILEYNGRYLALIEWAQQIKLMLYFVLICNVFFPWGMATTWSLSALMISLLMLVLKLVGCAFLLVLTETVLAKMRLFRVPYFLSIAFMLCMLAILIHIILEVV